MPSDKLATEAVANMNKPNAPAHSISFVAVNGWRGPGALAIAIAHLAAATDFVAFRLLQPIALVVDLFFVLSGLLISQAYAEKLKRPSAIPEYAVRRFGRIWPVQAATLTVLIGYELLKLTLQMTAGKQFSSPPFSPEGLNILPAVPTNLLLIHSLGLHDRETWNFPSWSLSVEFFTYLIFALVCLASPMLRRMLAVAIVIVSMAVLVLVAPYHMRSTFDFGLFRCFAGFFAGSLCYELVRKWPPSQTHRLLPTLIELGAIALLVVWLSMAVGSYWEFAAPFIICLFLSAFLHGRGLVSRILKSKPIQILADLSFAIYMVHAIVLLFMLAFLHEIERFSGTPLFSTAINPMAGHPGAAPTIQVLHLDSVALKWTIGVFYVATVLLLAVAIHKFVENPGRSVFSKLAKRIGTRRSSPRIVSQSTVGSA